MTGTGLMVRIDFHGDVLEAVEWDGKVWVSLRRCCENLGINPDSQRIKLRSKTWAVTAEIAATGPDAKTYQVFAVDLDTLPGWLFSIDARKVKPAVRDKLARYQKEAARVLADHFFGRASQPPVTAVPLDQIEAIVRRLLAEVRPLALTPVPAAPRFTVQERCRWKGWLTTNPQQRAEIRRRANFLLLDRHSETPDVAGGPGSPCVYYGHQLAVLDDAIDRVHQEYAREEGLGGPRLWD